MFTDEANRLYGVLTMRLHDRRYLAGDDFAIADIISYRWAVNWQAQNQDINESRHFKRWFEKMGARPVGQRGLAVGADLQASAGGNRPASAKILYDHRAIHLPD